MSTITYLLFLMVNHPITKKINQTPRSGSSSGSDYEENVTPEPPRRSQRLQNIAVNSASGLLASRTRSIIPRTLIMDSSNSHKTAATISIAPCFLGLRQQEPITYGQALRDSDSQLWQTAMETEINSLMAKNTCKMVDKCYAGTRATPVTWVCKVKTNP